MKSHKIGNRLLSAGGFVRQGAYLADIGTDHAYLPLFLLGEGRISRAICSDINEGPLESAKRNAEESALADKISFVLTDGAAALRDSGATDYAICGMGGELIADIIERAPHLKNPEIRLILQPMSRQSHLRRYLAASGFAVDGEDYSLDSGKYYLCLSAHYTGEKRELGDFEAELGECDPRVEFSHEKRGYIEGKIRALEKALVGKRRGGEPHPHEEAILAEYRKGTDK